MTHTTDDDLYERVDGASNVLLREASPGRPAAAACAALLTKTDPARTNVLFVTLTGSPDDPLAVWHERVGRTEPAAMGLVTIEGRSSSAEVGGDETRTIERIAGPGDLIGLGMAVSGLLEAWQDTGNRSVLCFQSVSALLGHAELERTFRFVHALTRRVEAAGAVAHYHVDPTAHDEPILSTLTELFDVVV